MCINTDDAIDFFIKLNILSIKFFANWLFFNSIYCVTFACKILANNAEPKSKEN